MSAVAQLWEDEWEVLLISLQVSWGGGPASPRPSEQDSASSSLLFLQTQAQRGAGKSPGHIASQAGRALQPRVPRLPVSSKTVCLPPG